MRISLRFENLLSAWLLLHMYVLVDVLDFVLSCCVRVVFSNTHWFTVVGGGCCNNSVLSEAANEVFVWLSKLFATGKVRQLPPLRLAAARTTGIRLAPSAELAALSPLLITTNKTRPLPKLLNHPTHTRVDVPPPVLST